MPEGSRKERSQLALPSALPTLQNRNTTPFVRGSSDIPNTRLHDVFVGQGLSIQTTPISHTHKAADLMKGAFFRQGKTTSRPRERRVTLAGSTEVTEDFHTWQSPLFQHLRHGRPRSKHSCVKKCQQHNASASWGGPDREQQ